MVHVEGKVVVDCPIDDVYNFLLDGTNNPLWRKSVTDSRIRRGKPLGEGAEFRQNVIGPGGMRADGDYKIVKCLKNELISFEVTSGPARPTGEYRLREQNGSTIVDLRMDFQPSLMNRLMEPLMRKALEDEMAALPKLKAYLEGKK